MNFKIKILNFSLLVEDYSKSNNFDYDNTYHIFFFRFIAESI